MATSPEAVRGQLVVVTAAASTDLLSEVSDLDPAKRAAAVLELLPLVVPAYYDAAGSLAVAWYDELRDEAQPTTSYAPSIIGEPETDWIEREVEKFQRELAADLDDAAQRIIDETTRLVEKEVARGFRQTITDNATADPDAAGWKRHARADACKFCLMLADKGAVYTEDTAVFAAHTNCHCIAAPEFGGEHIWAEASPIQYVASSRRASTEAAQAVRNAKLRTYLNENYPDARG